MNAARDGLDLGQLAPWFAAHVRGATAAPLRAELLAGGRSNLTYVVDDGTSTWVLRRPPLGHVVATAHDMAREFRVLQALGPSEVPVPRVDALCEDVEVIGAPFYVMEHVDGRTLQRARDLAVLSPDDARRCSTELVDVLVRLHAVDPDAVGLRDFGRPEGFLARNVARWGTQWEANKTRDLPQIDELGKRLARSVPTSGPAAILHGDYRLDNTLLAPDDAGRIVAVLDWEMSTVGDPLTDLGLFLVYWASDDGPAVGSSVAMAAVEGFLTKEQIVERYASESGRSVAHIDFYVVFATYKLAVIAEGITARVRMGKARGTGVDDLGQLVVELAEHALAMADASPDPGLHA